MTTVGDLRDIAESILEQLEGYDDGREVHAWNNTYFANGCTLETEDGFIEYDNIRVIDEDEDEEAE